jgi:hypothetical protein
MCQAPAQILLVPKLRIATSAAADPEALPLALEKGIANRVNSSYQSLLQLHESNYSRFNSQGGTDKRVRQAGTDPPRRICQWFDPPKSPKILAGHPSDTPAVATGELKYPPSAVRSEPPLRRPIALTILFHDNR